MTHPKPDLPPLPTRVAYSQAICGSFDVHWMEHFFNESIRLERRHDLFTAEQMESYALLERQAERERCAKLCDDYFPSEVYDPERGCEERAAAACAAAIRNQGRKG